MNADLQWGRDAGFFTHTAPQWLADRLFVRRDVANIFAYRQQKLRELFA